MTAFTYANPFILPLTLLIPLFLSDLSFAAVYNVSGNSPRWVMGNSPAAVTDVTEFDPACGVVLQFLPSESAALFFQGTSLIVYGTLEIPGPILDGGLTSPGDLYVWVDGKRGTTSYPDGPCYMEVCTWTDLDPQMTHNLTIAVLGPGSGPGNKLPAFWVKQAS
ncbi:hypothetical protein EXIGLDRAFT_775655 [Exidia glandulosa HHB12029]|uniref:Uncharacterized protein n=1 Tax=Exidia glandulosa HHB12029 TaxID=1314781 RepID=A0A165DU63_EXIGL|nr:hypothetical protein EXIGLDRAFT_775655 [Exidia glandulosa HHB12029]